MFKVLEVSKEVNLEQFSRLLWQRKISHRIHLIEGQQVLAVPKPDDVANALDLYRQWGSGQLQPSEADSADLASYFSLSEFVGKGFVAFSRAPISLVLIVICVVLAVIAPLNSNSNIMLSLLYPDFSLGTNTLNLPLILENFSLLQFFKMISPIFLHGGLLHLGFNMVMFWEFGKRIEAVQAGWCLLLLIVILALVSNTLQYLYGNEIYIRNSRFGGMSGVVYGLFAYIWMWQLFDPAKRLNLPGSLIFFILLSLGIMTYIGFASIADQAHIGGLLCGVVCGAITATISRVGRTNKE